MLKLLIILKKKKESSVPYMLWLGIKRNWINMMEHKTLSFIVELLTVTTYLTTWSAGGDYDIDL